MGPTSGTCGSRLTWTLSDGVLTISGTGAMSNYTSNSGTPWEARKASITKVVVGSGVTSIGDYAFYSCSKLATVNLPTGLKTIGACSMCNCDGLVTIVIPNTVTSIGNSVFEDCNKLKNVTLSDTLSSIGTAAFYSCTSLTSITLPDSLTSIGASAFRESYLSGITLPKNLTSMGSNVFYGCSNLAEVSWSSSLTFVPEKTFGWNNKRISEMSLPEGVTQISSNAFSGSSQLNTLYLPLSLEIIASGAFSSCSNLTDVYYAGTQAEAEQIQVGTGNAYLSSALWHYGVSTDDPDSEQYCGTSVTWTLSNTGHLQITGSGAMDGWTSSKHSPWYSRGSEIISVSIDSGVTTIGTYAFDSLSNLAVINLPASLSTIGNSAFRNCTSLSMVVYGGTSEQKDAISIGSNNTSVSGAEWICSDQDDSTGIGAFSGTCGSKLIWALSSDGTLVISGTGAMSNYTSTGGTPWEARKNSIRTVIVNSGVTSIGDYAFYDCINLVNVTLPDGLKTIGSYTFYDCDGLVSITLPSTVTSLGNSSFYGCDKLKSISLSDNLNSIGEYALAYCSSLTKISLPESLTTIGIFAFSDSYLSEIVLPNNLTNMGARVFDECTNLSEVTWSASVTVVPSGTFGYGTYNPNRIITMVLPEGVTGIGSNAFNGARQLTDLYLPASLESIESSAFSGCVNLSEVYFAGTQAQAEAIQIGTGNNYLTSANWHCSDGDSEGMGASSGTCGSRLTWTLTDGTLTISGTGAMSNYTSTGGTPWEARKNSIRTVIVNSGVTSIGDYAFCDCTNLVNVTLPDGLKTIGSVAFYNCDGLVSITLPSTVTSLGNSSFYGCDKLKSISLSDNLNSIGEYALAYCSSLTKISLPESLTTIGIFAFSDSYLSEIVLPNNLTNMGARVFDECTNLSEVTWSASVTVVPSGTFGYGTYNPNRIITMVLPEGVTGIGSNAFNGARQLTDLYLPASLESIESSAFSGCVNLSEVYFAGTQAQAEAIQIGTGNNYLTSANWHFGAVLPDNMTTLTLPASLRIIEEEAFAGVTAQQIIIPASVQTIGSSAFANCPNLLVVYFEGTSADIAGDLFTGCRNNVMISIPANSTLASWANTHGVQVIYH